MKIAFRSKPLVRLHGYSPEAPSDILARVSAGVSPSSLKGDFILVAEGFDVATGNPLTVLVSTVVAAVPYFFYITESQCVHSTNVFDCCKAAGLPWQWNWDALAQLALFGHVLGNASLHNEIFRVPQASIVKVCNGKKEVFSEPFWAELYSAVSYDAKRTDAPSILLDILSELPTSGSYSLSLSAGYDSRVLLACMDYLNRSMVVGCMGTPDSTDLRIAQQIAHYKGYDFKRVELEPRDYVTFADDIVKTTSGEKTFNHWHTGIYSRKVEFSPNSTHLAGSNGEYARSYFFDKGIIAELADISRFSRWDYWLALKNSTRRRVSPEILSLLEPDSNLRRVLDSGLQIKKAFMQGLRFNDGLDYFYTSERVRNFIGLGLALYRSAFPTMSPFLDARFIRYACNLRRYDKLGDRMHRNVIRQLNPELLDFPTDESGALMRCDPKLLYYAKHKPVKSYHRYEDAHEFPGVINWAYLGLYELGGSKELESNFAFQPSVKKWNLSITIGAILEHLQKSGIKKT